MTLDPGASKTTMIRSMPWTSPEHLETGREKKGPVPEASPPTPRRRPARKAAIIAPVELAAPGAPLRLRVAGKFFEDAEGNAFEMRAVVYGPFAPNSTGAPFPESEALRRDLRALRGLGANCLRVFHVPSPELLEICADLDLRLLVTFPWTQHADFLRSRELSDKVVAEFRETVASLAGNPVIAAFLVGNEVPPDIVRWCGAERVKDFLQDMVRAGRGADPGALFSYANFPSTEYLLPRNLDFLCFNLYLHDPEKLAAYLRRLHHLAGNMPLVIGEFGMDSAAEGEEAQAAYFREQVAVFRQLAVAGEVAFSFTDEWYTGGRYVEGWTFGLTRRDRSEKPAWAALRGAWAQPSDLPDVALPKMSVVVCAYNAAGTLRACLESLRHLQYPDYEVLLIDDGSRDRTPEIARDFPEVRYVRMEHAGLSAARNRGAELAAGEVLAYTDADCQAHPLWLHYAAQALVEGGYAAVGGPNIPPPARSRDQACVAAAPGGPREVMLNDRTAEHLPGCNLVVWKNSFNYAGGFDPIFRTAGDDVDFCWRLAACGFSLGFHPGAMVWHERRRNIGAYFRQQWGYGEAEAWLWRTHQQAFAGWGTMRWQGRIYESARPEAILPPRVYSGRFGDAPFQSVYTKPAAFLVPNSFEWFGLSCGWLLVDLAFGAAPLVPLLLFAAMIFAAVRAAVAAHIEGGFGGIRGRALLAALCLAQPVIRGTARWWNWFKLTRVSTRNIPLRPTGPDDKRRGLFSYWNTENRTKFELLPALLRRLQGWNVPHGVSDGWQRWDAQLLATPFIALRVLAATEYHGDGRNLLRVSATRRLTPAGYACLGLLLLVSLGLAFQFAGSSTQYSLLCLLLPVPFLTLILTSFHKLDRVLAEALRQAAEELGIQPVKDEAL